MTTPTPTQRAKAIKDLIFCLLEAIREVKQIPSGHLYAIVSSHVGLETYNAAIDIIVESGVVTRSNHMLTWVDPKKS